MSKIKRLIHKVTSATSSKRSSSGGTVSDKAAADISGHRNVIEFAKTNGEDHPLPQNGNGHHNHGRRRDGSLSLTDEKVLRSEAREAAEERERRKHDAEREEAYDDVRFSPPHVLRSSHQPVIRIL